MSNLDSLAEQIAKLLRSEERSSDLSAIGQALEQINKRLDALESSAGGNGMNSFRARETHPSIDKFTIAEAIADRIFSGVESEKACAFEPNGKPCDHCSMCNSRGF